MADQQDNDLLPETTDGFKVGEKKTLDEYSKMGMFGNHFHSNLQHLFYSLAVIFVRLFSIIAFRGLFLAQLETKFTPPTTV